MKVVGISGSPRNGNTAFLVKEALKAVEEEGIETQYISLAGKKLNPCLACDGCKKEGKCVVMDDINDILEEMVGAEGVIIGSPVYFGGVSAQLKMLFDRSRPYRRGFKLKNKVGGAIAVGAARNGGQETTIKDIHNFMLIHSMIVVGDSDPTAHYGGTGVGAHLEDCKRDEIGIETSRNLGKKVAQVVKLIGKRNI
ncbi:MAG TPA: flavodoxin family protein [Methanothermococcus okinawensis]|uniref:Flavodoxin family protein n=1 Tax=Methanothermococcus okinawensis TaxID=155863 RepID=A0A832ZKN1_9EURY|nr:flavodoxin family protein [Methanococcaceae archaeon]HIP84780.1 flavodoxin family protein [Methanothermococcus okinawensis]HIP91242.1 flavodoxin family protein [Methanothermococcus okinawensis]